MNTSISCSKYLSMITIWLKLENMNSTCIYYAYKNNQNRMDNSCLYTGIRVRMDIRAIRVSSTYPGIKG